MFRTPILAAALACACSCRALEPTIPARRGDPGLRAKQIPLSLGDEYAGQLAGPRPDASPVSHLERVPSEAPVRLLPDSEPRSIEFRDAPLGAVVESLAGELGLNVMLDPGLERSVNASFPSATAGAALEAILAEAGLGLVEQNGGILAVRPLAAAPSQTVTFELRSAVAAAAAETLKSVLGPQALIAVDGPANLLVVRAPRAQLLEAAAFLDQIDRARRQVLVEVRILEVTLNERFEFGVSAAIEDGSISGDLVGLTQALGTTDDSFSLSFASESGKVSAAIQAISRFAGTELVSSPRVLALSGSEAKIDVIREVPYINTTAVTSGTTGGVGSTVQEEVQFKEAGVRLKVTPTIQAGNQIQLKINQELSEVVDRFKDIPIVDKRTLTSDFLVGDRHTVVLGGVMQKRKAQVDKGIPGLMNLPVIGRAFRSDEDDDDKRELLVFVTPRIVDEAEASSLNDVLRQSYVENLAETGVESVGHPVRRSQP
jgi:general secretion pathway protein D